MRTVDQQEKIVEKLQEKALESPDPQTIHDLSVAVSSLETLHALERPA